MTETRSGGSGGGLHLSLKTELPKLENSVVRGLWIPKTSEPNLLLRRMESERNIPRFPKTDQLDLEHFNDQFARHRFAFETNM